MIIAPSAFNSEPTELERQRESVSLRLKKAFGFSLDETRNSGKLDFYPCDIFLY